MYKESKISVIIPAYNAELSIRKCLESTIKQTLPPHEIIVIDDGSTDKTAEIVKNFGDSVIFLNQENQGQGAARNTGLKKATGDYVAFLDADDYWLPEFLENCVNFLKNNSRAVAVNTGFRVKRKKGEYKGPSCIDELKEKYPAGFVLENFFDFWAEYDHVRTGTVLIRREVIGKAGFQRSDLRVSQDLEYWGYIATFGPWGLIPKILWVGDSTSIASKSGWRKKYNIRRRLCPEVESWEARIKPRIKSDEVACFAIVRGRVAAGYAHNKILAGNTESAFNIVRKYGSEMPRNRVTRLMLAGNRFGFVGRALVATLLKIREFAKG